MTIQTEACFTVPGGTKSGCAVLFLHVCVCVCVGFENMLILVSNVVPCAVMLQVLLRRPLVTMTENSYNVLGFRPVTM